MAPNRGTYTAIRENSNSQASNYPHLGRHRGAAVFLRSVIMCLLYTAATTYPSLVFVFKLSSYHGKLFVPCNEVACKFTKLIGDASLASTIHFGHALTHVFPIVINGQQRAEDELTWPPLCVGKSKEEMQALCASPSAMNKIQNTLGLGPSKVVHMVFVFGWFLFKVVHDCLLLRGGTLSLPRSVLVCCRWLVRCVRWPLHSRGDVTRHRKSNSSFWLCLCEAGKCPPSCDFLYFMTYDVPYRIVDQSVRNPTSSLLVATIRGHHAPSEGWTQEIVSLEQRRFLWALLRVVFDLGLGPVMILAFAIAIGPIMVQLISLVVASESAALGWAFLIILIIGPILSLFAHAGTFINFGSRQSGHCPLQEAFWQWSPTYRAWNIVVAVAEFVCACIATYVLVWPLLCHMIGYKEVDLDSIACLEYAVAGIVWLLFGLVRFIYYEIIMHTFNALSLKARAPFYPSEYLAWADMYPECDAHDEVKLGNDFLSVHGDIYGSDEGRRKQWTSDWEEAIQWSKRGKDGHFGQRVRIMLGCGGLQG